MADSPLDMSSTCRHVKTPQSSQFSCVRQGIVPTLHCFLGKPCTAASVMTHLAVFLPICSCARPKEW